MAASGALQQNITIESVDTVRWFSPPDDANVAYGFCSRCGSSLFWRVLDQENEGDLSFVGRAGRISTIVNVVCGC